MKILSLSILLLSISCSTSTTQENSAPPSWLKGSDVRYPEKEFWIGVGSGRNLQEANDAARGEIGKRIGSKVSSHESISETGGKQTEYARNVQLESSSFLTGVKIVENYKDVHSDTYFALGVLNRGQFLSHLMEEMARIDDALESLPKNFQNSFKAVEFIKDREFFEKHYAAVAGAPAPENPWDLSSKELIVKQREVLKKYPFKIQINKRDPQIMRMLEEFGFVIKPSSKNVLDVNMEEMDYPSSANLTRVKIIVNIDAKLESDEASVTLSQIGVGYSAVQAKEDGIKKIREMEMDKLVGLLAPMGEVSLE